MGLSTVSNKLETQTIASSFDQLLYLDHAAGMVDSTLKIVSTDTGHSALQLTNDQVLIKDKSGTDIAKCFEVQDKDGTICLSVNGTNNRVGIGTDAPAYLIDAAGAGAQSMRIYSSDNDAALIVASDTDEGQVSKVVFASDTTARGSIVYNHNTTDTNQNMRFVVGDNTNTAMTIEGDGKVGIGITSPTCPLDVQEDGANLTSSNMYTIMRTRRDNDYGGIHLGYDNTATHVSIVASGSANGDIAFWTHKDVVGFTEKMRIDDDGNVGIGTAAPNYGLHVSSTANTSIGISDSDFSGHGSSWYFKNDGGLFQLISADLNFGSSTARISVKNDGNVGIGDPAPGQLLGLMASAANDAYIELDTSQTTTSTGIIFSMNGGAEWRIEQNQGGNFLVYDYSDTSIAVSITPGAEVWAQGSDARIKKDVENIDSILDSINSLRPITWKRKYGKLDKTYAGLVAQEVKPHFPLVVEGEEDDFEELTPTEQNPEKYKGAMGIKYSSFVPYLIKAIQELSAKVTALENA